MMFAQDWKIAFRRNIGFWLAPLLAVAATYVSWQSRTKGVALWPEASAEIGFCQTLISCTFAGVGAWTARHERQHGVAELMLTVSAGQFRHLWNVWSSTVVWGLIPYIISGSVIGVWAERTATWGGPDWGPIIAGVCAIIAAVSFGFLCGTLVPVPYLPPLLIIAWWFADGYIATQSSWIQFLSPRTLYENVHRSVFFKPIPARVDGKQILWLVTLALLCICVSAMYTRRSKSTIFAVLLSLLLLLGSTGVLAGEPVSFSSREAAIIPYQPVCLTQSIEICVHPASRKLLGRVSAVLNPIMLPLAGVPGAPQRARQSEDQPAANASDTLVFPLFDASALGESMAFSTALELTHQAPSPNAGPLLSLPQAVVATWLFEQAGFPIDHAHFWQMMSSFRVVNSQAEFTDLQNQFDQTLARFHQLDPGSRHQWFMVNFQRLRQGSLPDSALP